MVYILNIEGQPLMPTKRHGKVRRLLKNKQARVVKRCPFTIQLLYETSNNTQSVTLGVDTGYRNIGLSATTSKKVLFEAEVILRTDIVDNLSTRRELRRGRRNRKTRYRKARFNNRVKNKKAGWLAPSFKQRIDCHLTMIAKLHKILPISKIIVEIASFDIQKIEHPDISGEEYQQGEQLGFWNVREYVFDRDGHTCQCCKGKSKDKVLNVHHIESRKTGGNAPNNLITLCETCHQNYHKGLIKLPSNIKRGTPHRPETYMNVMRKRLFNKLKEQYPNVGVTYGYITKNTRIKYNLSKEHYVDARCISRNPLAESSGEIFYYKKVRCHNRQLHKCNAIKGGIRKECRIVYKQFGLRLQDKVSFNGEEGFVSGRIVASGQTVIKHIDGTKITARKYDKYKFVETRHNYICERKTIKGCEDYEQAG